MYCIEILPKLRSLVQDAPSLDSDPASQMSKLHASRHSRLAPSYVVQIDRDRLYRMLVLAKRVTLTLKPKSPTGDDYKIRPERPPAVRHTARLPLASNLG